MNTDFENGHDALTDETRRKLKNLSQAFLRLHKVLLDAEKEKYEAVNGPIPNPNIYLSLVLEHPHFAWLRKISSLIALIDEAASIRRPATETEAAALVNEARILLSFQYSEEEFNAKFQIALQENKHAVLNYNDVLGLID
jgi:hypothetical protein